MDGGENGSGTLGRMKNKNLASKWEGADSF